MRRNGLLFLLLLVASSLWAQHAKTSVQSLSEREVPKVLAAASRQYDEVTTAHSFSFTAKSPIDTDNVMRILLPCEPKNVKVGVASRSSWDEATHTLLLEFENRPEGVQVTLEW